MRKKKELLFIDELTGLKNKRYLRHVKENIIPELVAENKKFTLSMVDIDHFKEINDIYGHLKGDEAIHFFAQFLKNNLRKDDIVVRYGGDEFVILQEGLSRNDAFVIWQRLVEKSKRLKFHGFKLTMSVGIASYPEDGESFESLFEVADIRLYSAKRAGRASVGEYGGNRIRIPSIKFVNRAEEVDRLLSNISNGVITVIKGESGVGKTRLIREVLSGIRNREILWSDCLALERKISYYPLREIVKYKLLRGGKDLIKYIPEAYRVEIGKIVPEVLEGIESEGNSGFDRVLDRYRLLEGFNYVFNLGEKAKIIVIDNAQWMDEDSLEALKYIIRNRNPDTVFIFASRTEDKVEKSEEFFRGLSREHPVDEIFLSPLSEAHIKEIVRIIVGAEISLLEEYVASNAGGSVFYAEEIVKSLFELGYLRFMGNTWDFKEPEEEIAPRGAEDVVMRKFSRLSEDGKELARILSVARKGYIELLMALTGFNEGRVFGLVDECLKGGLFVENEEYEFVEYRNELVREIVYKREISGLKKRRLHKRVAEWLEKHCPEGNEEDLAYHYRMANIKEKVVEYGLSSAKKARELYTNRSALKYYNWVLEALRPWENSKEKARKYAEVLLSVIDVKEHLGLFEEAMKLTGEALKLSEKFNFADIKGRVFNLKAILLWRMGKIKEAMRLLEEGVEYLYSANLSEEIGMVYNTLGILYNTQGEYKKAIEVLEKGLLFSEEKERLKTKALINIGNALNYMGEYEKALDYYERARDISKKEGDKKRYEIASLNVGLIYYNFMKYKEALISYEDALNVAEEIGDTVVKAHLYNNIGLIYIGQGNFPEAEQYLMKSYKIVKKIGERELIGYIYNNIGVIYGAKGKYKKALDYFLKSYGIARKIGDKRIMVLSGTNVGSTLALLGEKERGESILKDSLDLAKEMGISELVLLAINALTEFYLDSTELKKAGELIEEGEKIITSSKIEGDVEVDFLLNRARFCILTGKNSILCEIFKEIERELKEKNNMKGELSYSIIRTEYHLRRGEKDEARAFLKKINKLLKKYRDITKKAYYLFYRWWLADLTHEKNAEEYIRKAERLFQSLGLSHKLKSLIDITRRNC